MSAEVIDVQTADNVAKWFLVNNKARGLGTNVEYITNLKLQKLLYYAQGCHLAIYGKPLFNEPIVAWTYGPVVESVYRTYKRFGDFGISEFDTCTDSFSDDEKKILIGTDETFGQFSAWKLVEMTHNEAPWKETPRNEIIPVDKIKAYFEKNYVEED